MGKCANCGYLSVRNKDDYSLGEPSIDYREKGQVATTWDDKGRNPHSLHEPIPLCFARQAYLRDATKAIKDRKNPYEEVKAIIQGDNDCKEFTDWQQGFTPKEHREMMDRQKLQEWQDKREQIDRDWYTNQERYLVRRAGIYAIVAGIIGAGIGAFITWLLTN